MTSNNLKRKLTTILSADVKGYGRLIGEDEEWTCNAPLLWALHHQNMKIDSLGGEPYFRTE